MLSHVWWHRFVITATWGKLRLEKKNHSLGYQVNSRPLKQLGKTLTQNTKRSRTEAQQSACLASVGP